MGVHRPVPADSSGEPWTGRALSDSGFGSDDGAASSELASALASGDLRLVVAALVSARVLVPVVATLDQAGTSPDGETIDKAAHMSVVTLRGADGRLALPVFSGLDSLAAWNPSARPVPVTGADAAVAAFDEGAVALLIDPGGPHRAVLEGPALRALAEGRVPVAPIEDPAVAAAVAEAARSVGLLPQAVRLRAGTSVDLVVELTAPGGWTDETVTQVASALGRQLAEDTLLRTRLGRGLDLDVRRGHE